MAERVSDDPGFAIRLYDGPRAELRHLFELAEDSAAELDAYLALGRVFVAISEGEVLGHLQLVDAARPGSSEIKNMAVLEAQRGRGIGRALVSEAVSRARASSWSTLLVATAAADIGNLRFYQRLGFRMLRVERDAFTPASGYPAGTLVDGIELRDRVWLDMTLT